MEGENHEKREENVSSESNNNHNTESKPNVAHSGVPAFASEDVPSVEGEDVGKSKSVISMGTAPTHVPTTKAKDEQQLTKSMRENPWMLSTMVLGAIVLVLLFLGNFSGGITGNVVAAGVVSADTVGDNLVEYLNTVAEEDVTLIDVEDDGFMYLVTVEYRGEELPIYVTKDGERYTPSLLPITDGAVSTPSNTATPTTPEVVKSDNPLTELFIMTHCPYGT
ncbi:hypothetical protein KAR91_15150, partial [Candidatus Pacearchaeota archaeon]|nr:hypothetical protein [Candidatus Pacearchaeota archaeon]